MVTKCKLMNNHRDCLNFHHHILQDLALYRPRTMLSMMLWSMEPPIHCKDNWYCMTQLYMLMNIHHDQSNFHHHIVNSLSTTHLHILKCKNCYLYSMDVSTRHRDNSHCKIIKCKWMNIHHDRLYFRHRTLQDQLWYRHHTMLNMFRWLLATPNHYKHRLERMSCRLLQIQQEHLNNSNIHCRDNMTNSWLNCTSNTSCLSIKWQERKSCRKYRWVNQCR